MVREPESAEQRALMDILFSDSPWESLGSLYTIFVDALEAPREVQLIAGDADIEALEAIVEAEAGKRGYRVDIKRNYRAGDTEDIVEGISVTISHG